MKAKLAELEYNRLLKMFGKVHGDNKYFMTKSELQQVVLGSDVSKIIKSEKCPIIQRLEGNRSTITFSIANVAMWLADPTYNHKNTTKEK